MPDDHDDGVELSERARRRLEDLRYLGELSEDDVQRLGCRLVETVHGADHARDHIRLWSAVDEEGYIHDVRYRTLATGLELLAFDLMAELCIGVTVDQAAGITPRHVAERLRLVYEQEDVDLPWPLDTPFAVLVKLANRFRGIQHEEQPGDGAAAGPASDWDTIGLFEKVRRIEQVLDEQVRPMLAADGGGMDLVDLRDDELVVEYHGLCGSCSAAFGGTLFFIEDTLSNALGTELRITVQGMEAEPFVDL